MAWNNPIDIGAMPIGAMKLGRPTARALINMKNKANRPAAASGGQRPLFPMPQMFAPGGYSATMPTVNYGGGAGISGDVAHRLAEEYRRAMEEGKTANETRYADINAGYDARRTGALSAADQMLAGFGGLLQSSQQAGDNLQAGYQQRYNTAIGNLAGLGDSELADVDRSYKEMGASQQQSLVDRGLANSTVVDADQRGNERDRQVARNRVNESIRQQRLGVESQLSGDTLAAQGRQQGNQQSLQMQLLQALSQRQGLDAQLSGDKLNFMERRTDTYPSLDQYSDLMLKLGNSGYRPASGYGSKAPAKKLGVIPARGTYMGPGGGGTYMGFGTR